MKAVVWKGDDLGANYDYIDIPADMKDAAELARAELIDIVASLDDDVLEAYLNGEELTEEQIQKCIRKGTIHSQITQYYVVVHLRIKAYRLFLMQ